MGSARWRTSCWVNTASSPMATGPDSSQPPIATATCAPHSAATAPASPTARAAISQPRGAVPTVRVLEKSSPGKDDGGPWGTGGGAHEPPGGPYWTPAPPAGGDESAG